MEQINPGLISLAISSRTRNITMEQNGDPARGLSEYREEWIKVEIDQEQRGRPFKKKLIERQTSQRGNLK